MSMQGLAATGQIEAGFALLTRVEASGWLTHSWDECYLIFHTLLEACCLVGDFNSSSQVQAVLEGLGLIAVAPSATALVQGLAPWTDDGRRHSDCVVTSSDSRYI